jgi:hypothetical protein
MHWNSWSFSSSCGRQPVDQYVWVSGLPLGSLTRFYLALLLSVDNYVVLLSMRPLWRENGSVIYCTIASGPCQSNHTRAEVSQNSRPYLTVSSETPPTWRARFPYLYPPGTGWSSYTPGDYGGSILTRLHTGYWNRFSVKTLIIQCFHNALYWPVIRRLCSKPSWVSVTILFILTNSMDLSPS